MAQRKGRNTGTGRTLEDLILPVLERNGYTYLTQVNIGQRLGGRRHVVDIVARHKETGRTLLISLKWQQTSGTAEQKVPFEAMCLAEAILQGKGRFHAAYIVLGGDGWSLRDFFTGGGLDRHLKFADLVDVVTLEQFIAKANRQEL